MRPTGLQEVPRAVVTDVLPITDGQLAILQVVNAGGAMVAKMQPSQRFVSWALIGLGAVLLFSMLRLRFSWWPLHPIFVLVWGSWHMGVYSFSILLGWAIKVFATRLGGSGFYQKLKPMMIGLIAGDVLAAVIKLAVSTIYFYATGLAAPA